MFYEFLKDIFPTLEEGAPLIAKALGFPHLSNVAKWAMSLISEAFDLDEDNIDKLPDAIMNDPDHLHKLQEVDQKFSTMIMSRPKEICVTNAEINIKLFYSTPPTLQ